MATPTQHGAASQLGWFTGVCVICTSAWELKVWLEKNGCSFRWFFKEQRTYWYWLLLLWCLCSSFTFWSKRQRTWGATKIDHHENEKRCCVSSSCAKKMANKILKHLFSFSEGLLIFCLGEMTDSPVIIIERSL